MSPQVMPYGLLIALFKRQKVFLRIFLGITLCAVIYLMFSTAKYESVAQLVVRFGDRSIPTVNRTAMSEMTPSDRREIVLANAAILGSHDMAQATIEAMGLDVIYPGIAKNPPSGWSAMDEAVRTFLRNLSVDVGPQDNIISLSFMHTDKNLVPKITQKLIDLYVDHQADVYQNPQRGFLKTETSEANKRLEFAQAALQDFQTKWHITDFEQEVTDLLKQRSDVSASLRGAEASLAQAQRRQADLERSMKNVPAEIPEQANGEKYRSVDEAETRLAELRSKQSQMLATYSPKSPLMASINAAVATTSAEVARRRAELDKRASSSPNSVYQTLQTDYLRTSADVESNAEPVRILTEKLAGIEQRLTEMQQNRRAFNDLMRERQIAEETYKSLSTQFEDARVKDSLNQQRISPAAVISQPTEPYRSARPRVMVTLLAAIFGGFIVALGYVLVLEAMDNRFTSAAQVAWVLDLPVFASFERAAITAPRALLSYRGAT